MVHIPSTHRAVAMAPLAATPVPQSRSYLRRCLEQARLRRAVAYLDDRLLRDVGLTRAGLPAPRADWLG